MKRILFIMESLKGGGAEKVLIEILKKLDYTLYAVDLCLILNQGIYMSDLPEDVTLIPLFPNRKIYRILKKISKTIKSNFIFRLIIALKIKTQYDIEISFMQGPSFKIHSLIKSNARKLTWIHCNINFERYWVDSFFPFEEAKLAYQKVDKIVSVSHDALFQFNKLTGNIPVSKEVFYNPINREEIVVQAESFSVNKHKFTICTIGRHEPLKAYDRLIRVASRLVEEGYDFEIWMVGSGQLDTELKQLAKKLKVETYIRFIGFQKNPFPYLKQADIFVNTSITEGFPLVISEAVCLGKAIVATDVTGTNEILDNGKYGILTGQKDDDILDGLRTMMSNETLRKEFGRKALERSKMFNITESIKEFIRIIET